LSYIWAGMPGRKKTRGRIGLILIGAVVAATLAAGSAFAVSETIVGTPLNTFDKASYTSDQGDIVTLQVTGSTHNVTASQTGPDGGPLFSSATISGGTTPVNGTQFLSPGSYPFICTVHPDTMVATLVKQATGTALTRPDIEVKLKSTKIEKVASRGKLVVEVRAVTKSDDVSVEAKLGKASLGKKEGLDLAAGAKQNVTVRLSKSAKSKLASRNKATVKVLGEVPFGLPDTAKGKLR
jgi:plastocyanin